MKEILNKIYEGKIFIPEYKYESYKVSKKINEWGRAYGEITRKGIESMVVELKKRNIFNNINFLDLGSGNGRAVLHMGMYKEVENSHGIEIYKSKYDYSKKLLNNIENYNNKDKINFINKDFNSIKNFHNYNLILINNINTGKTSQLEIINKIKKGSLILCCFELIDNHGLEKLEDIISDFSWSYGYQAYLKLYIKK